MNPNTTAEMTESIRVTAATAANGRAVIDALNPAIGPASIEGQFDEVISAYWTLDAVLRLTDPYDAYVIACYSNHPVIGALREVKHEPVLGIMEASLIEALSLGHRYSIVTTSARWRPLLEDAVRTYGLESRCASVRSSGLSVLDLERLPSDRIAARLEEVAQLAVQEDGAEVICLGCAGMTGLEAKLRRTLPVPVIDGVRAAVHQVLGLAESGLSTSKLRLYQQIMDRDADGLPEGIARTYRRAERR